MSNVSRVIPLEYLVQRPEKVTTIEASNICPTLMTSSDLSFQVRRTTRPWNKGKSYGTLSLAVFNRLRLQKGRDKRENSVQWGVQAEKISFSFSCRTRSLYHNAKNMFVSLNEQVTGYDEIRHFLSRMSSSLLVTIRVNTLPYFLSRRKKVALTAWFLTLKALIGMSTITILRWTSSGQFFSFWPRLLHGICRPRWCLLLNSF